MKNVKGWASFELPCGQIAIVDLADYATCALYNWNSRTNYVHSKIVGYLHRFLMKPTAGMVVDHINGNPLDNRRANLRVCSRKENMRNQKMRSDNKSGYRGVYWETSCNKWRAIIRLDGKKFHLGVFESKKDAAKAYNDAATYHFGEFARVNDV